MDYSLKENQANEKICVYEKILRAIQLPKYPEIPDCSLVCNINNLVI